MKNIDVNKIVEMYLEAYGPTFAPFYPAEMHFRIYKTAEWLKGIADKLYAEYRGISGEKLSEGERTTISVLLHSTHVAIGEILERKTDEEREKYKIKIIKVFMGEFKSDTIIVRTTTGERVIRIDYFDFIPWFPHDTVFLFLDKFLGFDKPWGFDEKYADSIGYESDFFEPVQLDYGMWCIKEIEGKKRVFTPLEENYEYEEVYKVVSYLTPLIKEFLKRVKNYKFPLSEKEYVEFMEKRGYDNPGSEESMNKAVQKWEKFIKNNSWRLK